MTMVPPVPPRQRRDPFDPEREFYVVREFRCAGEVLMPGQDFDKDTVTVRLLRQLFERRMISLRPDAFGIVAELAPESVKKLSTVNGQALKPSRKRLTMRRRLSTPVEA